MVHKYKTKQGLLIRLIAYFFQKAKQDGKDISFLESVDFNLNLFAGLSKQKQEVYLKQTLKELDIIAELVSEMEDSWKTGDVDRLSSIIMKSFQGYPEIYSRFVTQRNKYWIARIEELLQKDSNALVIVGAGHLVGKESVVKLLQNKGYKLEQR